ncbi:hypothetical protein [Brevundimonas sp.]|uniref:hypothetical protein n=1 Tax=Brevundimonas sp. TaxID=1871086 RepID=UPI002FCA431A
MSMVEILPDARYRRGTFIAMAGYVVTLMAAVYLTDRQMVSGPLLYLLATLPGVAIIGQLWVTLRYLRDADEFVRTLLAKRLIVSCLATFGIMTVWGFLETFAGVPHLAAWWGYCLMWFLLGVSSLFIRDSK